MKDIIDGKLYDTEKAEEIDSYSYGMHGDLEYISEVLYKTEKGNYFIAGEGGAKTKYRKQVGQGTVSGSERIIPLTEKESYDWLEAHSDAETILEEFPEKVEEA